MVILIKVSNFVEEVPEEVISEDILEVNEDGYFYEDIPSEEPWILNQDEFSSIKPLKVEPETFYVSSGEHLSQQPCHHLSNDPFQIPPMKVPLPSLQLSIPI